MPYIEIDLPAENDISGIAESRVQVRGYNPKYTDSFDEIKNINDDKFFKVKTDCVCKYLV